MEIQPVAHIHTSFPEKFGIPRQSGLAAALRGKVVFTPEYRNPDCLRGLEGFSHIWLIWEFSANARHGWQPTVRPPRLGGNEHMGVFATRSPFRPNALGLSCVEVESIDYSSECGPVIYVKGADLMDGTPIYDIKPYIRYSDSRPDAVCGYVDSLAERHLEVCVPEEFADLLSEAGIYESLVQTLALDPRPSYHDDSEREYGMAFSGYNVRFRVEGNLLSVYNVEIIK